MLYSADKMFNTTIVSVKSVKVNNYAVVIYQTSRCSSGESRLAIRVQESLRCVTINASNRDENVTWQSNISTEAGK